MTEEAYDTLFDTNAKGAYFTAQKLVPLIVDGGSVVFVTSVANALGVPMISAYAATKAALRSMTRSLAAEFVARGIRSGSATDRPSFPRTPLFGTTPAWNLSIRGYQRFEPIAETQMVSAIPGIVGITPLDGEAWQRQNRKPT